MVCLALSKPRSSGWMDAMRRRYDGSATARAMARAVVSKNKFRQIVALNFQENHASQDIQRSMHNDDHEILFVRDCLHHSVLRA